MAIIAGDTFAERAIAGTLSARQDTTGGRNGTVRGVWTIGTAYKINDLVTSSGQTYIAKDTHTAGATFASDLTAHWSLLAGSGSDVNVNGSHVATLNVTTPVAPADIGAATAAALTSEISRAQSAEALLKPPAYYLNGGVNLRESIPRPASVSDTPTALTSGVMTLVAIVLYAGDVIANLTFRSHTTAAVTPTNWWFALYNSSFALLSQTADQGTAAWTANTSRTRALGAPQTIGTSGVYYAGVMVAATTVPSLTCMNITSGMNGVGAVIASQKLVAGTFGTALTTTAPASAATPASLGPIPYAVAS